MGVPSCGLNGSLLLAMTKEVWDLGTDKKTGGNTIEKAVAESFRRAACERGRIGNAGTPLVASDRMLHDGTAVVVVIENKEGGGGGRVHV
jgi:hypothetical protein